MYSVYFWEYRCVSLLVTKTLTKGNMCVYVCLCVFVCVSLLARVCVYRILCLEDPVLKEAFMYSHRPIPRPFASWACPQCTGPRPQPFISGLVLTLFSPFFTSIYPLMTVAIFSLHLFQPDDDHKCPPDLGHMPRWTRGQGRPGYLHPWSPGPKLNSSLTKYRHKHFQRCKEPG